MKSQEKKKWLSDRGRWIGFRTNAAYCFPTSTLISTVLGTMMGRKEREWGQTGVSRIDGTSGCTIEPPAATEYAVLPVGVATISPSPLKHKDERGKKRREEKKPRGGG
jgi:hypothetical protein